MRDPPGSRALLKMSSVGVLKMKISAGNFHFCSAKRCCCVDCSKIFNLTVADNDTALHDCLFVLGRGATK